jgi:hypothetical protein
MYTEQDIPVNLFIQNNALPTHFKQAAASLLTTFVPAECFGECGLYSGPSLFNVVGNLSFPKNLGIVRVVGGVNCTGNLSIGKSTTLHVTDTVTVNGSIARTARANSATDYWRCSLSY